LAVKFFIAFHLLYTPKSAQLNVFKSIIFVAVNSDYGKKTFLVLQRGVPEDAPRDPGAAYASFSLKNRYRCWGLRCRFANRWTTGGAEQAGWQQSGRAFFQPPTRNCMYCYEDDA